MRKNLQLALMASIATLLSFSTPPLQAQVGITTSTDEGGRKVYVNDAVTQPKKASRPTTYISSGLVYWSPSAHRFKPVAPASIRAARYAAAEVNQSEEASSLFRAGKPFTAQDIDAAIEAAAARHNVDPSLVRSVIKVESNFNPNAVSRAGAMGLMQLMPQTARSLNVTNPFDPEQNVDAGVRHLKKLMESYGGDVKLTLAAYNAGQGAVARSAGVPHFGETRNYVKRITQLYYGGFTPGTSLSSNPVYAPVKVERDERGVLYIS